MNILESGKVGRVQILGVDYSGAKADNNTWVARGSLAGRELILEECSRISRAELAEALAGCLGPTIVALDFPFATPRAFAEYWLPGCSRMPQQWRAAAGMDYDAFLDLRDRFVAGQGEPKRACDPPESYSCLHMVNPIMLPMTFRGMQMLDRLWRGETANSVSAPPLPERSREGASETVLMEVMPGAVLRRMGLPYKGYKGGKRARERRKLIVEELPGRSGPVKFDFGSLKQTVLASHDALDSVVAAVAAALWALDPGRFPQPPNEGEPGFDPAVFLEGWLYAPVPGNH